MDAPRRRSNRNHKRYSVQKIVSYQEDGKNFLTLTVDLGLGGMKINTHSTIPEGYRQPFDLVLGTDSIRVMGRIVHNGPLRGGQKVAGIQFMGLLGHERQLLKDYLGNLEELQIMSGLPGMGRRGKMPRKSSKEKGPRAKKVYFEFHAPEAEMVSLAGNFNDWDVNALPMKKDKKGNWKTSLNLGPGRYEYRFYVDETWKDDPNAQEWVGNPFGGRNSVRVVG